MYKAMKRIPFLLTFYLLLGASRLVADSYPAMGMVLAVDRAHASIEVSCRAVPGRTEAKILTIPLRNGAELDGIERGMLIDFELAFRGSAMYAQKVRVHVYEDTAQEPMQARQLEILDASTSDPKQAAGTLHSGQVVPDFSLINQRQERIALSNFAGKTVALTFIYTKCPLPNFCFRMSNNFGMLNERFASRMGKDLVLLSISFDPVHDQPEVLSEYARTFTRNQANWHFLTGDLADVQRLCRSFGMNFWQDEGLLTHSLHTVIIDRDGRLVANLEGNDYSAKQLGDLVEAVLGETK
jgi:protein SCO1